MRPSQVTTLSRTNKLQAPHLSPSIFIGWPMTMTSGARLNSTLQPKKLSTHILVHLSKLNTPMALTSYARHLFLKSMLRTLCTSCVTGDILVHQRAIFHPIIGPPTLTFIVCKNGGYLMTTHSASFGLVIQSSNNSGTTQA